MSDRIEAAANAISESSGMRFDGFWFRVDELEPEDRDYALAEATAALSAADAVMFSNEAVERAAQTMRFLSRPGMGPWADETELGKASWRESALAVIAALKGEA